MQLIDRRALALVAVSLAVGCRDHHEPTTTGPATSASTARTTTTPATTPTGPIAFDPDAPVLVDTIGAPIRSARTWTTALAPNARGGWNLIAQTYETNAVTPTEWTILDLATGKTKSVEGTSRMYAVQKYQVKNQLRAPNGRIFFPEVEVRMAYYDPADETVHELGPILEPRGNNRTIYASVFGPDGKLYMGTQSDTLPTILQFDPDTLKTKRLGEVGLHRNGYSYGYYIAVDPPWVYVAVGESPWELAALDMRTGQSTVLATVTDQPWLQVEQRPEGVLAKVITKLRTPEQKTEQFWCVDGKLVPFANKPQRALKRIENPLTAPPELDVASINPDNQGIVHVRWRNPGAAWSELSYQTKYSTQIDLESLFALPDGSLLGSATQYHGFFRYRPSDHSTVAFGQHGPSKPWGALFGSALYLVGYPNGELYSYDFNQPWTAQGMDPNHDQSVNPRWLGTFYRDSNAKYASGLIASKDRLYFTGRRERDGVGATVGYYVPKTAQFVGHHKDLSFLDPRGFAVVEAADRVVLSGWVHPDPERPNETPAEAQLVVFDRELAEVERVTIQPGLQSTGELFTMPDSTAIVGLSREGNTLYRYDLATKKLDVHALPGKITGAAQRSDGSIWTVVDDHLTRIDFDTLATVGIGEAGSILHDAEHLVWQGDDLYYIVHAELRRILHAGVK